jgi:hypothetical protein
MLPSWSPVLLITIASLAPAFAIIIDLALFKQISLSFAFGKESFV